MTMLHTFCCRLCLHDGSVHRLLDIFSVVELRMKIMEVFQVKINISDACTTNICWSCLEETLEQYEHYQQYKEEHHTIILNQKLLVAKSKKSNCNDIGISSPLPSTCSETEVTKQIINSKNLNASSQTSTEPCDNTVVSSRNQRHQVNSNVSSESNQDNLRNSICNLSQQAIPNKRKRPDNVCELNSTRKAEGVIPTPNQKKHATRTTNVEHLYNNTLINHTDRETNTIGVRRDESTVTTQNSRSKVVSTENSNFHKRIFESRMDVANNSNSIVAEQLQVVAIHRNSSSSGDDSPVSYVIRKVVEPRIPINIDASTAAASNASSQTGKTSIMTKNSRIAPTISNIVYRKVDSLNRCCNNGLMDEVPLTLSRQDMSQKNVHVNLTADSETSACVEVPTILSEEQTIPNGSSVHYSSASIANAVATNVSEKPNLHAPSIAERIVSNTFSNEGTLTKNHQSIVNNIISNQLPPTLPTITKRRHSTYIRVSSNLFDEPPEKAQFAMLNNNLVLRNPTTLRNSVPSPLLDYSSTNTMVQEKINASMINTSSISTFDRNVMNHNIPATSSINRSQLIDDSTIREGNNPMAKGLFINTQKHNLALRIVDSRTQNQRISSHDVQRRENAVVNTNNKVIEPVFNSSIGGSHIIYEGRPTNQFSFNVGTRIRACFKCNLCNMHYLMISALKTHVLRVHNVVCSESQYSIIYNEEIVKKLVTRSRRKSVAAPETLGESLTNRLVN